MSMSTTRKLALTVTLAVGVAGLAHAQVFGYTGHEQILTVPTGVYAYTVQTWAAGGGISGGSGAYVTGLLLVHPGQILTMTVGGAAGGVYYNEGVAGRTFGGGGYAYGAHDVLAGNGGGATFAFLDGTLAAVAGAGAGGTRVTIGAHNTRGGGAGGTYVGGLPGNNPSVGNATGGTQSAGGSVNGGYLHGGDPIGPGAGGGGGYYGGGGGTGANLSQYSLFPGAGGSSYWGGLLNPYFEGGTTGSISGNVLPGGATAPNYVAGAGIGGFNNGGNGLIVLTATPVPEPSILITLALPAVGLLRRRKTVGITKTGEQTR